jgi:hypothetical protein
VLGVQGEGFSEKGHWNVSFDWRYQKSFRHFIGTQEQFQRIEEGSEVINRINLADLSIRYNLTDRTDLSVSIPYLMATRSMAIRNAQRQIVGRYLNQTHGIGDLVFFGHTWLFDPKSLPEQNVQLGLGFKIPTGQDNATDTRQGIVNGQIANVAVQTVDQSIQPGDGGFGFLFDLQAHKLLLERKAALYLGATYMSTPEGTNGVPTYRGRASEAEMSIADQYLLRAGVSVNVPWVHGMAGTLGLRWEGVPARDLIGSSEGFRRPGYAVSIEPGVSYTRNGTTLSLAVPVAIRRDRIVSVPDEADNTQGDAAFADWLLLVGISHKF